MFENLPIIKIKAVEKKDTRHDWTTKKFFWNENLSLSGLVWLSHAFHDFFKRSSI